MRELFLLDPGLTFLNHGSFGACPREVFDAHVRWQRETERNPVEFLGRRSAGLLRAARSRLAGGELARSARVAEARLQRAEHHEGIDVSERRML
jgi:hypothetical protein